MASSSYHIEKHARKTQSINYKSPESPKNRALVGVLKERRIALDCGKPPLHSQLSNDILPVLRMALDEDGKNIFKNISVLLC